MLFIQGRIQPVSCKRAGRASHVERRRVYTWCVGSVCWWHLEGSFYRPDVVADGRKEMLTLRLYIHRLDSVMGMRD